MWRIILSHSFPSVHLPHWYPNRIPKFWKIFQTRPLSYPPSCRLYKDNGVAIPVHSAQLPPVVACSGCDDSRKHAIFVEIFKRWFFTRCRFHKRQIPELLVTNRGNVDTKSFNEFFISQRSRCQRDITGWWKWVAVDHTTDNWRYIHLVFIPALQRDR